MGFSQHAGMVVVADDDARRPEAQRVLTTNQQWGLLRVDRLRRAIQVAPRARRARADAHNLAMAMSSTGSIVLLAVPAIVDDDRRIVLEAALKLIEAAGEGKMTRVDGPDQRPRDTAQGARHGRDARRPCDPALAGSDHVSTAKVLAAALGTLEFDMVFPA